MIEKIFSSASFGFHDFKVEGPALLVISATIAFVILSTWSLVWVCNDARRRNKPPLVALIFILAAGWPFSFIWWFWLRPAKLISKPKKTPRHACISANPRGIHLRQDGRAS
jgi:hypothetical protein